jgi:hypothetical protein
LQKPSSFNADVSAIASRPAVPKMRAQVSEERVLTWLSVKDIDYRKVKRIPETLDLLKVAREFHGHTVGLHVPKITLDTLDLQSCIM